MCLRLSLLNLLQGQALPTSMTSRQDQSRAVIRSAAPTLVLPATARPSQEYLNRLRNARAGTQGAEAGSGVQSFRGSLGASEFDPSLQQIRGPETPSRPRKALRTPGNLFRNLGESCLFSTEQEKKVGHSLTETPKRSRFPGCPLRGFLLLGHR